MREDTNYFINNCFKDDESFKELFPLDIQPMACHHWSPLHVISRSVDFLNTHPGCKILDIGSGVGKFCLAGASYAPDANFFGVEQREYLVEHAQEVQNNLGLTNVTFIKGNFTWLDLKQFDHIYFFNSFYENLSGFNRIDDTIEYSESLYEYYVRYLHSELKSMPSGTRVVTFHSLQEEIPYGYEFVESSEGDDLIFWIKK